MKPQMDTDERRSESTAKNSKLTHMAKDSLPKNLCLSVSICGFRSSLQIRLPYLASRFRGQRIRQDRRRGAGLVECDRCIRTARGGGVCFGQFGMRGQQQLLALHGLAAGAAHGAWPCHFFISVE